MKRFVVALDSSSKAQDAAFQQFLKDHKLGWWHWLSNLWLIKDPSGDLTAGALRDELKSIYPKVYTMVFELRAKNDTWAGYGPTSEDRNMFDWIKRNW